MSVQQTTGSSSTAPIESKPLFSILLKILSAFVFSVMFALVKLLTETIPTGEIVFARSFFDLLPILVMVVASGRLGAALRTNHPFMHAKSALFVVGAMFLWFSALKYPQLTDATAIAYAMPLISLILAHFILHEVIRVYP